MKAVRDGHWSRPSSDLGFVGMMAFLNFCQTLMVAIQVVCSPKKGGNRAFQSRGKLLKELALDRHRK